MGDACGEVPRLKAGAMKAELVPENGDPPIPIVRDLTVVGRHPDCDVVIDHQGVSKRHCVLVRTDGLLVIRDLATTNGTKVKGQRIRWAALLPDDRISLSGYKFRIYLGSDEMPSPLDYFRARLGRPPGAAAEAGAPAAWSRSKSKPAQRDFPAPSAPAMPAPDGFPNDPTAEKDLLDFPLDDDSEEIIDLG